MSKEKLDSLDPGLRYKRIHAISEMDRAMREDNWMIYTMYLSRLKRLFNLDNGKLAKILKTSKVAVWKTLSGNGYGHGDTHVRPRRRHKAEDLLNWFRENLDAP